MLKSRHLQFPLIFKIKIIRGANEKTNYHIVPLQFLSFRESEPTVKEKKTRNEF